MKRKRFSMAAAFAGVLLVLSIFVVMERFGILAQEHPSALTELPKNYLDQEKAADQRPKESLLLSDESETSQRYTEQMTFILESMNVGYDQYLITESHHEPLQSLTDYQTIIISSNQFDRLMEQGYLEPIFDWVDQGGGLLTLIPNAHSEAVAIYKEHFGIETMKSGGITIDRMQILTDFMVGSKGFEYDLEGFSTYAMDVAMDVEIKDGPLIHVVQPETNTPIVWEMEHGAGRIVVNNIDMSEKTTRGMLAAEYSLLMDTFAYPVINTSVYFIDDFPAPFPEGSDEFITATYQMDVRSFFANVWLPDIVKIAKHYQIPFTNMLIDTYEDDTTPPFNEPIDKELFTFYGNLMLSLGGEIGYHGYNHQPLVLDGFPFSEDLGYTTWNSTEEMMGAMKTLSENTKWLFPKEQPSVYVPPSNILSSEAREALPETLEEVKTISGLYVVTGSEYEQEFSVAPDGIVELPRTVSGLELSTYDRWLAMNELNFHFINSHFFHPDDLLDEERGAEKGWEYLKAQFEEYLNWLQESAPGLRNQRASDGAKAVQRYYAAEVSRSQTGSEYHIHTKNFYDQLYLIVRIRENRVQKVTGGELTPLTSELYLLEAQEPTVTIHLEE